VADFEEERTHMTMFVHEHILYHLDRTECNRILIRAPVKSGKREIVEYIAQRDNCHNPHRVHAFISAWHRCADDEQREELEIHNLRVFSINRPTVKTKCIEWIQNHIRAGKKVVLHLDECDFGTGQRQLLGDIFRNFRNHDQTTFLLYSATPQEVIFSGEVDEKDEEEYRDLVDEVIYTGVKVEYIPPEGYCGPSRFLNEGLIFEAKPFFYIEGNHIRLSEQGRQILHDLRESIKEQPSRNIVILRLSSSDIKGDGTRKENKHIYQLLRYANRCADLEGIEIVTDKKETNEFSQSLKGIQQENIQWSNEGYWRRQASGIPILLVIDQTASRSTELKCHHRLFAYHDFRNTVTFTTISQAQERVNHYEQTYREFQPIRVYGHKKTFELSAGRIDYNHYMNHEWKKHKIDHRVAARDGLPEGDHYRIKHTENGTIHPDYPEPVTLKQANQILQELGCYVEVKVSARVQGREKDQPIFGCKFIPCQPHEFQHIKEQIKNLLPAPDQGHNFQNPFIESRKQGLVDGKWQGNLRGWQVFEYESDIENGERGCGVTGSGGNARLTICYNHGVLGVVVRWNTGEKERVNSLSTFNSMYHQQ
jgi:hypothetical protein